MKYVPYDAIPQKQNFTNALEEFKSLINDRFFSVNQLFFVLYMNNNDYWNDLEQGRAEAHPIIYNGSISPFDYSSRFNLLTKKITQNFDALISKLKNIPEKIMFVDAQKFYFQNMLEDFEPVMSQFLDGSKSKISEKFPDHFQVRMPNEVVNEYMIDEDLQYHIEEKCPLWFLYIEFSCISNIIEILDRKRDQLMLLKLAEISLTESFQQNVNPQSLSGEEVQASTSSRKKSETQILVLPENFKLPKMNFVAPRLDIRQTALLFNYLKKYNVILDYQDDSLAKIVSSLTGHSEQNIRTGEGFGMIQYIKQDHPDSKTKKFKSEPNHNLIVLRYLLVEILEDLDTQMNENIERYKK